MSTPCNEEVFIALLSSACLFSRALGEDQRGGQGDKYTQQYNQGAHCPRRMMSWCPTPEAGRVRIRLMEK